MDIIIHFNGKQCDVRIKVQPSGGTWQTVASARWSNNGMDERSWTLKGNISGYSGMHKIKIELYGATGYGKINGNVILTLK